MTQLEPESRQRMSDGAFPATPPRPPPAPHLAPAPDTPLSPARGLVRWVDAAVVTAAELTKSVLRESWGVCSQLINWGAQTAVSTLAPGYRAASRTRLDSAESLRDVLASGQRAPAPRRSSWSLLDAGGALASPPLHESGAHVLATRGGDGRTLFERGEFAAHRGKPTASLDRSASSLTGDAKLAVLVAVDAVALRLRECARAGLQGRQRDGPPPQVRGWCCCRRPQRVQAPGGAPIPLAAVGNVVHARSSLESPSRCVDADEAPAQHGSDSATRVLITRICGYAAEVHSVRTVDGYVLSLLRIPRVGASRVALFQHGIVDTASAWVSTGSVFSLAARAYQRGYDVFLCNLRGTNDAMAANGLVLGGGRISGGEAGAAAAAAAATSPPASVGPCLPEDGPFWDFSVDDHALDVAAHVRYVRRLKHAEAPRRRELQAQLAAQRRAAELARRQWRSGGVRGGEAQSLSTGSDSTDSEAPVAGSGSDTGAAGVDSADSLGGETPKPPEQGESNSDVRVIAVGHSSESLREHAGRGCPRPLPPLAPASGRLRPPHLPPRLRRAAAAVGALPRSPLVPRRAAPAPPRAAPRRAPLVLLRRPHVRVAAVPAPVSSCAGQRWGWRHTRSVLSFFLSSHPRAILSYTCSAS